MQKSFQHIGRRPDSEAASPSPSNTESTSYEEIPALNPTSEQANGGFDSWLDNFSFDSPMSYETPVDDGSNETPEPADPTALMGSGAAMTNSVFGSFSVSTMAYTNPLDAEIGRNAHLPGRPQRVLQDTSLPSSSDDHMRQLYVVHLVNAAIDGTKAVDGAQISKRWSRIWQSDAGQLIDTGRKTVEHMAWLILAKLEDFHHSGPSNLPSAYKDKKKLNMLPTRHGEGAFAQHVIDIAEALRVNKSICLNVVDSHDKVSTLVADTETTLQRKAAFRQSNQVRKIRYDANNIQRKKVDETMSVVDELTPDSLKRKIQDVIKETEKAEREGRLKLLAASSNKVRVEQGETSTQALPAANLSIRTIPTAADNNATSYDLGLPAEFGQSRQQQLPSRVIPATHTHASEDGRIERELNIQWPATQYTQQTQGFGGLQQDTQNGTSGHGSISRGQAKRYTDNNF